MLSYYTILLVLKSGQLTTSFPGFSPTRPKRLRRAGRREPWERGWTVDSQSV